MATIGIALIDDNPTLLRNLSQNLLVFDEIAICFMASNGEEALEKLKYHQPDVILMDIEMPLMNGIQTTIEIKKLYPNQKIMMLTIFDKEDKVFEAIKAGASGYLLKDEKPSRIVACIEELWEGGAPMSPIIAMKTLELLRKQQVNKENLETTELPESFNLSRREIEILEKISAGLTYNQIAENLFISAKTARKHIENIYQKLHVHSKIEAIRFAEKNKWI